jgi:hypothetical protein
LRERQIPNSESGGDSSQRGHLFNSTTLISAATLIVRNSTLTVKKMKNSLWRATGRDAPVI